MLYNSHRKNIDNMRASDIEQYLAVKSPSKKGIPKNDCEALPKWSCSSNETINLKFIKEEDELFTEDDYFHPVYTNQVEMSLKLNRFSMIKNSFMAI